MLLNINAQVGLKLTSKGIKILEEDWREYKKVIPSFSSDRPHTIDSEGYCLMSLWEVMSIFGNELYNGNSELPFSMEIRLQDKDLIKEE